MEIPGELSQFSALLASLSIAESLEKQYPELTKSDM